MTESLQNAVEQLKKALSESEELKKYNAAKEAYNGDKKLMSLVNEYNLQAAILEQEGRKPENEKDAELIQSISQRLRALYDEIDDNPRLLEMRKAEDELSLVINSINLAVQYTVAPESAGQECTHDCSTCGGCH